MRRSSYTDRHNEPKDLQRIKDRLLYRVKGPDGCFSEECLKRLLSAKPCLHRANIMKKADNESDFKHCMANLAQDLKGSRCRTTIRLGLGIGIHASWQAFAGALQQRQLRRSARVTEYCLAHRRVRATRLHSHTGRRRDHTRHPLYTRHPKKSALLYSANMELPDVV